MTLTPMQRAEFLERVSAASKLQGPYGGSHLRVTVFPKRTSFESAWTSVSLRVDGARSVKLTRRFPDVECIPRQGLGELLLEDIEACLRALTPNADMMAQQLGELSKQLQRWGTR